MAAFAAARDNDTPEPLTAAWTHVSAGWDQPARHDALLAVTTQLNAYAWAAARYRDAARERPDDKIATAQLERLRKATEATLLATATARAANQPKPYRATTAVLAILIIAAIAGLVYAFARGTSSTPDAAPPPTSPAQPAGR